MLQVHDEIEVECDKDVALKIGDEMHGNNTFFKKGRNTTYIS